MAMSAVGLSDMLVGSPPVNNCGYRIPFITDHAGTYFGKATYGDRASVLLVTPAMTGQRQLPTNCKNCGAAFNRWDDDCNYCGTIKL